jgi:hypothetical protein
MADGNDQNFDGGRKNQSISLNCLLKNKINLRIDF